MCRKLRKDIATQSGNQMSTLDSAKLIERTTLLTDQMRSLTRFVRPQNNTTLAIRGRVWDRNLRKGQ